MFCGNNPSKSTSVSFPPHVPAPALTSMSERYPPIVPQPTSAIRFPANVFDLGMLRWARYRSSILITETGITFSPKLESLRSASLVF